MLTTTTTQLLAWTCDFDSILREFFFLKFAVPLGSFTVGIFGPFFIHFSFIFHFILFPFFSQN